MSTSKTSLALWQRSLLVLLLFGTLFQGYHLLDNSRQEVPAVWKTIGQSRLWRSANFAHSQRFAGFVLFLNQTIPLQARVVLPPQGSGPRLFSHTPWMQYFLIPRDVVNCTGAGTSCQQRFIDSDAYILVADPQQFPGDKAADLEQRLHMFDQDWGLLLPEAAGEASGWSDGGFDSVIDIASRAILPVLWLALLALPGWLMVRRNLADWSEWTKLFAGLCLGVGAFTFSLYLCLLFIQTVSTGLIWTLTLLWAVTALYVWRRNTISAATSIRFLPDGWQAAILLLTALNLYLAVGKSYFASDELIIWANKGYAIADQGLSQGASTWGLSSWKYTLNVPLLIASFEKGFGDPLPVSKMVFPLYAAALMLFIYDFLRQYLPRGAAGLAALAFGTSTIILRHSQIGYANLPFTTQLVFAAALLIKTLEAEQAAAQRPRLLLAGVFFALAAWTRAEGFVIGLVLICLGIYLGRRKWGENWLNQVLWLALPLLLMASVWGCTSGLAYTLPRSNSGALANAIVQMLRGNLNLNEARYALSSLLGFLLDLDTWGVVGVGVLFFSWLPRRISPGRTASSLLWSGGLLVIMIALGTIHATSYNGGCDVSCWVNSGLDRYIMPGITLLWLESMRRVFSRVD